jgi:hypothetical protein
MQTILKTYPFKGTGNFSKLFDKILRGQEQASGFLYPSKQICAGYHTSLNKFLRGIIPLGKNLRGGNRTHRTNYAGSVSTSFSLSVSLSVSLSLSLSLSVSLSMSVSVSVSASLSLPCTCSCPFPVRIPIPVPVPVFLRVLFSVHVPLPVRVPVHVRVPVWSCSCPCTHS